MGLETVFNYIDDMNNAWPTNTPDQVKEAANHLRGVKEAVQGSFPNLGQGAVNLTAAQINQMIIDIADNLTAIGVNAGNISTNASNIATNAGDINTNEVAITNLNNIKIERTNYATSTAGGTLKARLSGTTLYLSNNGTNP